MSVKQVFWWPLWFIFMQKGCEIQKSQGIANKWHWQDWSHQTRGPKPACLFILWNTPNSSASWSSSSSGAYLWAQDFPSLSLSCLFFFFLTFFFFLLSYAKNLSFLFMINHSSRHSRFRMLKNQGAHDLTKDFCS